jgi:hypothetical protein
MLFINSNRLSALSFPQHPKLHCGEDRYDEEEDVSYGAGVAHAIGTFEGVLVDAIDEGGGST